MRSITSQTTAAIVSVVSRRSSGVGPAGANGRSATKTTTSCTGDQHHQRRRAEEKDRAPAGAPAQVDQRSGAEEQRHRHDNHHRCTRAAAPAGPRRGEIGRWHLGIEKRAAAGRRDHERQRSIGTGRVADVRADPHRDERGREQERIVQFRSTLQLTKRLFDDDGGDAGSRKGGNRLDSNQARTEGSGRDQQSGRTLQSLAGKVQHPPTPGQRRRVAVVNGDAGASTFGVAEGGADNVEQPPDRSLIARHSPDRRFLAGDLLGHPAERRRAGIDPLLKLQLDLCQRCRVGRSEPGPFEAPTTQADDQRHGGADAQDAQDGSHV